MTEAGPDDTLQGGRPWMLHCTGCHRPYPSGGMPYRCPSCGGIYDYASMPEYVPPVGCRLGRKGLTRYRAVLPLPDTARLVSLGEGGTPLLPIELAGRAVHMKCEYLNPTGSFKDRGASVMVSVLLAAGVADAVEDSSGNAGAAFAAYAARAGIRARVFVPEYASGPKRAQIEAFGADLCPVPGPRSAAAEAVLKAVERGAVYASHVYQPHGIAGLATIAYEIVEQLGTAPGAVVVPVGHGTLLLGLERGFRAMGGAGLLERVPKLIGVQARACAPLWAVHTGGAASLACVVEGETRAEGVRILRPPRGDAVLAAVEASMGSFVAVEEKQLLAGRDALARRGLYVEATSALVWPALEEVLPELPDPVVAVLTGSGLKDRAPV